MLFLFLLSAILSFRNIPYAHSGRFEEATMVDSVDTRSDHTQRGGLFPQYFRPDMDWSNPKDNPIREDNHVLTIHTPSCTGSRPVVVFIHGGSYHNGGGETHFYDTDALAAEQDLVTVNISYRLGVLGYNGTNYGLHDQILALRWVRNHIAEFGGNPEQITVMGQSAGAQSIIYILASLDEPLFRRAIILSAPAGITMSPAQQRINCCRYNRLLGADIQTAAVEQIIEAQGAYIRKYPNQAMPFAPAGIRQMPRHFRSGVKDVLVTIQNHDAAMFAAMFKHKSQAEFGTPSDHRLERLFTNVAFRNPSRRYVRYLNRQGVHAELFTFCWQPKDAPYGACHCAELPLLMGSPEFWQTTTFVGSESVEEIQRRGRLLRAAVGRYARTGEWIYAE